MAVLTKSPAHGRRSSSGSGGLRPVMPFELDEGGTAVEEDEEDYWALENEGDEYDDGIFKA